MDALSDAQRFKIAESRQASFRHFANKKSKGQRGSLVLARGWVPPHMRKNALMERVIFPEGTTIVFLNLRSKFDASKYATYVKLMSDSAISNCGCD